MARQFRLTHPRNALIAVCTACGFRGLQIFCNDQVRRQRYLPRSARAKASSALAIWSITSGSGAGSLR